MRGGVLDMALAYSLARRQQGQMALKHAFAPLVDLIYPPRCPTCGEAIAAQEGLCLECWKLLELADARTDDGSMSAAVIYNDIARDLVLGFKRGGKISLAPMLARLIAAQLPPLEGDWLLVPVPLHRWRLWQRGFNQSALLARSLAQLTGYDLLVDALLRTKRTPSLGGLGASERRAVMDGAIIANRHHCERLHGANIVLVDDVVTSGATSDACIAALRQAGAVRVHLACFARRQNERD